jgi:circadian clock protein KaiB
LSNVSPRSTPPSSESNEDGGGRFLLKLYVAGRGTRAEAAIANLRKLCENELRGQYELEIIDVLERPDLAEDARILATPTLIKQLPPPLRRVIGDLSDREKLLFGLEVKPAASDASHTPKP